MDVGGEGRLQLGPGLADPREDDPPRRYSGNESAAQLAFGNDIGAGPERGKMAEYGKVRIRLYRVADQGPLGGEGLGKAPVCAGKAGAGIEIKRSADRRRDPRDRDLFGVQL